MPLLNVENLSVDFVTRNGVNRAVDNLSFQVEAGKVTAIIGESGSGKSVACYSLLGLVPQPPGKIEGGSAMFEGRDLLQCSQSQLQKIRGRDIAMVFQDPMTCLNPYMTIGKQLIEPLRLHQNISKSDARARAIELMQEVGIRDPDQTIDQYPHQFSGGMRQRVMIAMALINEPKLLIADEPTTALDVTLQAQILELLSQLRQKRNIGILFISHDLSVVADIADNIYVMRQGSVVESGSSYRVFETPEHEYTKQLLAAIPRAMHSGKPRNTTTLVEVNRLSTWFGQAQGQPLKAVDNVSFEIQKGEVLGLVGESGSGKSTLGRTLLQLIAPHSGRTFYDGVDLGEMSTAELSALRRKMQIIFQDPFSSLNPRMTVQDTLAEPLLWHGIASRSTVGSAVMSLMDDVGLPRSAVRKYPHEFSGGQRQRIAIGRALATRPEFVVADEPVSALDVTIQAQILSLLEDLGNEYGLTMLFISHDLAVVRQIADRIMVMRKGKIVELASTQNLFEHPQEHYTQELLRAIPGDKILAPN
ncbi:MAG: ABC transporter ATP-binding protein [Halioglobus sp.]